MRQEGRNDGDLAGTGMTVAVGEKNHRDRWAPQLSAGPQLFWCILFLIASFLQVEKNPIHRGNAELSLVREHVFMWLQPQNEGLNLFRYLTGAHILDSRHRDHWVHCYS